MAESSEIIFKHNNGCQTTACSQEAEQSVLGGLMLNDQHWFDLVEILQPSDFYRNQHQLIYQAMIELLIKMKLWTVTVSEKLKSKAILDKTGGI